MDNEELVNLYQAGDNQALESLREQNMGIVNSIVNQYHIKDNSVYDRNDLEQEGILGLITAAQRYDFSNQHKAQFITYLVYWIRAKISRYISKNANNGISMQTPVGEDFTLEDIIPDTTNYEDMATESVYDEELKEDLYTSMRKRNTLKEREVLKCFYGLDNMEPMELQGIADLLNINVSNVGSIKASALIKLKHSSAALKYKRDYKQEKQARKYNSVATLVNCI